ncbi:MAG: DUF1540 domain-containing protein [Clostridia bacterium]
MNNLECQVNSCEHNCNHLCKLNKIHVEGPGACSTSQTCCSSFNVCGTSAQNNISSHSAKEATDICCKAENCKHNKNNKCLASSVQMQCMCGAPCVMSETACQTFIPR